MCSKKKQKTESYNVYPNPIFRGSQITVEIPVFKSGEAKIQFYNVSGQLVLQKKLNQGVKIQKLQLPNLAAGVYEVVILGDQLRQKLTGKLVVL